MAKIDSDHTGSDTHLFACEAIGCDHFVEVTIDHTPGEWPYLTLTGSYRAADGVKGWLGFFGEWTDPRTWFDPDCWSPAEGRLGTMLRVARKDPIGLRWVTLDEATARALRDVLDDFLTRRAAHRASVAGDTTSPGD